MPYLGRLAWVIAHFHKYENLNHQRFTLFGKMGSDTRVPDPWMECSSLNLTAMEKLRPHGVASIERQMDALNHSHIELKQ